MFEYRDQIKTFQANVSNSDEAEAMADFAISECGKMDIISCDASTFVNGATLTVDGGWSAF